ncbi:beta-mannosidase-like [Littorina saxatilis]|uniref:beta-mannosidase-like n=1 Tax=Littorina saxatilis TaxID=31220 RepID=UPI0038B69A68
MAQSQSVLLVAEGIDTVSTVFINGRAVMGTDNMFVKYTLDVKPFVKPGNNTIQLSFQSATDFAKKQADTYPYTVPPTCTLPVQHGECHVNFIRKEQCSFSWDWGPSFPTQGIWLPIYLTAFRSAVMDMATVEVVPDPRGVSVGWLLKTNTYYNVSTGATVEGVLLVTLEGTAIAERFHLTLSSSNTWAGFDLNVPQSTGVKRWWPNGYGNQTLYDVSFTFTASDGEVTSQRKRIGFRTIELVQDPVSRDPTQGLTFYFRVNDLPIFMKGANWIPPESFLELVTRDQVRTLLQAAVDAHMNIVRVCGVGIYETEDFFDLTDELGLLVFHGMVFCDSLYPTNQEFLDSVKREATYQVRRLTHRPSLLLWTGNNENQDIVDGQRSGENFSVYYKDYVKLYVSTLMPIVNHENPSRPYLISDQSNGKNTTKEGYLDSNPNSEYYGDVHSYQYLVDQWKPDQLLIPRFLTEYGVQAWCLYDTLVPVFQQSDMAYNSSQAVHRQHHPDGVTQIEWEIWRHLDFPPATTPQPERFKRMIYLTLINQAMSIKSETEHYRRHQGSLRDDGRGLTMGALYWQLNDLWQAPTWSSIDYSGRWKMLHYYALKFFSPLLVSPYLDGDFLDVFVVVDQIPTREVRDPRTKRLRFEPMAKVEDIAKSSVEKEDVLELATKVKRAISGVLTVEVYSWHSFKPLRQLTVPYKLTTTAESVYRANVSSMTSQAGCTSGKDCFIRVFLNDESDDVNNWIYVTELRDANLAKANVKITAVREISPRVFTITLTTTAIAPFVWLEAGSIMGRFSDNGFLLVKPSTTVKFSAWRDVDTDVLLEHLSVRSLMDVYN